jgi:hypothetical protein
MARTITKIDIEKDYFEWMVELVCENRFGNSVSFRKLLTHLHKTKFTFTIRKDSGREEDGVNLRYRYAYESGFVCADGYLDGDCTMLEMLIALAIRCETDIMDNPAYGDRTTQWFWMMIVNLGLGDMTDDLYDEENVTKILTRFLKRKYEPNGKGGLFTIRNCEYDLRYVELWTQMCWFLNGFE